MKAEKHWQQVGLYPHHGVALSLSSLRSQKSSGIGEFYDLLPLINWIKSIGFDCIQLLPLNDTGADTSPYDALSSCALDPMYLSLHALDDKTSAESFHALTNQPRTPIQEVKQQKIDWLYRYFQKNFKAIAQTPTYAAFLQNHSWLLPYALFKTYKRQFNHLSWKDWPSPFGEYNLKHLHASEESVQFYSFLQFLCYEQLSHVKNYASSQHVFLKGDIPILLSPDSADVWANRSLFALSLAAGSPPDYYNKDGQKWGFPLTNWESMRQTNFSWWKERLKTSGLFFHLYRIDHVVGFFRIWAIPPAKQAKEGHFIPEDPQLWAAHGEDILEMMLDTSNMLPIAEDLGTIPKEVPTILKHLGICGTKVIRWQRDWEHRQGAFIPYSNYEPFSMTTVSTHDCDTLSGWWQNFPDEAKAFADFKGWTHENKLSEKRLLEILQDAHRTPSYFHINLLQEYLALFPKLIHASPEQERINIPGTQSDQNWTYRFVPYLEEIINHKPLADVMRSLVR
ncbi:MAG: 4-alpha-glucanotransferase [Chlamydiae bacterium]|nr:4-alpha-glucanotransferase [Chlamydiota bacterium]